MVTPAASRPDGLLLRAERVQLLMAVAAEQAGIVARRQVLAHGLTDEWIEHRIAVQR